MGKKGKESHIMKIAIGSKNPAKIAAVKEAFKDKQIEFIAVDADSGVSAQPMSDEETIQGAINRAIAAAEKGGADIGIGLEGGVQSTAHGLMLCNWGALSVKGMDPIIAGGARLPLPEEVADKVLAGTELGPVMDEYASKQNVRKNEGAVGIFTNGQINRSEMFTHVMKLLAGQYEYKREQNKKL
jgi:inosine/xanthosine triphosphatase